MKRLIILALVSATGALAAGQAFAADAPPSDRIATFASACDDLKAGQTEMAAKAQGAKLTALGKGDLAKIAPITLTEPGPDGYMDGAKTLALSSEVLRGWWLDAGHTSEVVYQEGAGNGHKYRSCKVIVHAPDASVVIKTLLALHPRKSPDAWTDTTGKKLVVFGQPLSGPEDPAAGGDVSVMLDAGVPFPDMTFILVAQDPQYAPHTPHPIAVTQAEVYGGTAKPGVVTYTRRTTIG